MSEDRKLEKKEPVARTDAFSVSPVAVPPAAASARDDRLAIVEELVPGPSEHKPPSDDPTFQKMEPNSGIRLRCVFLHFEL